MILVIVFGAIFLTMFSGVSGFIYLQHKQAMQKVAWQESLAIAESGINYYRWHLAHAPTDLQDGTGQPGPYVHSYSDPESGVVGTYSLDIDGEINCGLTSGIVITSTGWTEDYPDLKRSVSVRYVKPTVADFAYLINDNVWAGADREIKGPYHSNGGIRMDGENNALVTSAKETWTCTSSFGCNPPGTEDGVFGDGENSDLWRFPVPSFDFGGITIDLASIKGITSGGNGVYFPASGAEGYRVVVNADRTMDVYRVDSLDSIYNYTSEDGWHWLDYGIDSESFLGNYVIPSDCGLVFMEDNLWVSDLNEESKVSGKVTMVSADLIDPNKETDVWIQGNITYTTKDGSDGLVLIAQRNNLISLYTPNSTELEGVFIAQNGYFGRNHYPDWYDPYHTRDKLEMYGSVVSNGRVGTKWSCSGIYCSGYNQRENTYDPELSFSPPPFLPSTSDEQEIKEWKEVD